MWTFAFKIGIKKLIPSYSDVTGVAALFVGSLNCS